MPVGPLQHINHVGVGIEDLQLAGQEQALGRADVLCAEYRPGKKVRCLA